MMRKIEIDVNQKQNTQGYDHNSHVQWCASFHSDEVFLKLQQFVVENQTLIILDTLIQFQYLQLQVLKIIMILNIFVFIML